ncbi:MAG: hypothetical protein AB1505_28315, partial [Candidatus Latescibacterota bacterium]
RCTRVALLHQGHLIRTESPGRLVAALEGALLEVRAAQPQAAYRALCGHPRWGRVHVVGERLHVLAEGGGSSAAQVERHLQGAGLTGIEVRPARPNLEDAYIELVRARQEREER